jgi:hypothetical protein
MLSSKRAGFRGLRDGGRRALIRAALAPTRRAGKVLALDQCFRNGPVPALSSHGRLLTRPQPVPRFSKLFDFQCDLGCLLSQFNIFRLQHL